MGSVKEKLKVIIIDEDPTFLRVWEKVFRRMEDCRYCLTNDPKTAMTLAREGPIDLLISEVIMEKGSGFELAEEVHKNNKEAEVILTTTYDCDLTRFNLDNPRFHILHKPYQRIEDVIHFVADILHRKDPRLDADEDSWSENDAFPSVMEWKL